MTEPDSTELDRWREDLHADCGRYCEAIIGLAVLAVMIGVLAYACGVIG